jgi:hypothetical protein
MSLLPLGSVPGTAVSILIGFAKAVLIVRVFMEFGRAGEISKVWFFMAIGWLAILSSIMLDYAARPWDARPKSWNPQPEARVIGTGTNAGPPTPMEEK